MAYGKNRLKPSILLLKSKRYIFYIHYDPIVTSIILFIFDHEMFQLKSTKYWLPPNTRANTYYVSCVHTFIKIISFTCLLHCLALGYLSPTWITFVRIILANDVETNPGDFVNNFFTFCNWNLNSLAKDNFYRVKLLEAHNSSHNYDFISICERSLDDTVELPDVMWENYYFVLCNNPS